MSETLSAGTVSIGVKPDTSGFGSSLKSGILGGTAGVGEGMGSMILGGLKTMAGPIMAVTAAFSIKHFVDDSVKAFEDLAGSVKGMQRITGGSVEDVSKLRGAMQLAGVDTSNITGAITIFSKKLGTAAGDAKDTAAMNKLFGESIKDANGHVKSMAELLPGLADKFKEMPNGAEKTALATQLFGRSGAQLIPVLNKGSEGIAELSQKAQDMGLVLNDAAMKTFAESKESARNFNAAIQGLKVSIGSDLLPVIDAVQNIFRNALTPVLQSATKFLNEHRDSFVKFGEVIGGIGKGAMAGIGDVFKSVGASLGQLGPVFSGLLPQVMQLMSAFSPFGLMFKAIQPVLPEIIKLITGLAVTIGTTLAGVLKEILPPITMVVNVLVTTLSGVFKQLMPAITELASLLAENFGNVVKALAPVVVMLVQAVAALIPPLMPIITQIVQLVITAIMPLAEAIVPLISALLPVLTNLFKFIIPIISGVAQVLEAILVPIIKLAIGALGGIITVVVNIITWFANFVTSIAKTASNIQQFFLDLPKNIQRWLGSIGTWLSEAGKNLIQGLIDGANAMGGAIADWVHNLGNSIVNGFKSLLGIHSPSTVFHDFGTNIGEGLANGIRLQVDPVTGVIKNLGTAVSENMDTIVTGIGGKLINITSMTNQVNSAYKGFKDAGISPSAAMSLAGGGQQLQSQLDSALGQVTFTNPVTGMSATFMQPDGTDSYMQSVVQAYQAAGYKQTSGTTIIYNAAPNDSISAEQKLVDAVQRAKVLGGTA